MPGRADGFRVLEQYSKLPVERYRYVPDADDEVVRSIRTGILFLQAFWSGSSYISFRRLAEVLLRLDVPHLELVVIDVDGWQNLYENPQLRHRIHGYGEAAWIRDGKIVFVTDGKTSAEELESIARNFVNRNSEPEGHDLYRGQL
jgi:hypothetical protein